MSTVELTQENIDGIVSDNDIVFVDFWAEWCGPCKAFGPVYENASEQNDDIVFGKVDTEAQMELARAFNIRSIPTIAAFKGGELVFSQPGAVPAAAFDSLIEQVRAAEPQS